LIALGATITAPCPHDGTCPMQGGDWCHFGVRVQRSRLQRRVKSGDRGFEDEKYSYVVASKQSPAERSSRILRRPERRGGHIRLRLCTDVGAEDIVVAKRDGERYRWARKAEWGDTFDGSSGR
jgi:ribosomal protein RSM22 (predicted rRNA methylase)